MLPSLPARWIYGEKLAFQENDQVEFKEVAVFSGLFKNRTRKDSGLPKYRETLIGFLNSVGQGYLIMGIKDDGTIVGVEDMTDDSIDKFKLWVDSSFNSLVYKNGKPIDPSTISIKFYTYPVEGHASNVVVVEAINKGKPLDIMLRSGTIIYRLNASNFKVSTEPVYRKRDVKGMIQAVQMRMQRVVDQKRKEIKDLQEKHEEELEKREKDTKAFINEISKSLYEKYNKEEKDDLFSKVMKLFTY
jgi:hypothetical protein